jgi:formate dehydrogenase major subunit
MTNHWNDFQHSDVWLVIGANPASNHPIAFRWITKGREQKGSKLIVADPWFTQSAAMADLYVPLRPGTDTAFLNGIMNYAIQNNLFHREYVVAYTNASYIVHPDFKIEDGLFSGFLESGKYDTSTWQYTGEKDPTLQHPNCVFQILKRHLSRYDIKTVSEITGAPADVYEEVCKLYCSTGKPDRVGNAIYCMGLTQHTHGTQNVRALAMLQLLLGNVGLPGGGVNAERGESNVQGACDIGVLFHVLPGYNPVPSAKAHPTWAAYREKTTPSTGYWVNRPKFLVSMLKAWYGEHATGENDFCYDFLPKTAADHSHVSTFQDMTKGVVKGMFAWGQNPVVGGPSAVQAREAMKNLEWLVCVDLFETETAAFWKAPGADPAKIATEVFLLPAACSYEKEGSITNSGRWIQWRWQAVEPPGEARSDLWIADRLFKAIRKEYQENGGVFPDPILKMKWDYGEAECDVVKVALEINGYEVATGAPVQSFTKLADDGSTACGDWLYSGYYNDVHNPPCKRRDNVDPYGLACFHRWAFSWPANRRILYNRCSVDPSGRPWHPERALFMWKGTGWIKNDVPDFNAKLPPVETADKAFIMLPEGQARLFAPGVKDGPVPEHYEPVESPVGNRMSGQQHNPLAVLWKGSIFDKYAPAESADFPYVATTFRLPEHYQTGGVTRNQPYLVELAPEMFVMISKTLAEKLGLKSGDWVRVATARSEFKAKVAVSSLVRPLTVQGRKIEMVCIPWHWGFQGLATGAIGNDLTPAAGDPNTRIPEYKAFLCNVHKV